jgi:hypothetical protein
MIAAKWELGLIPNFGASDIHLFIITTSMEKWKNSCEKRESE